MAETEAKPKYEVTGYDKAGNVVYHLLVEAVNSDVAKLYARAHLERTPDGADVVRSAVRTEVKAASRTRSARRGSAGR